VSHYFKNKQNAQHNRKELSFRFLGIELTLMTDSGVFSKNHLDKGAQLLIENAHQHFHGIDFCDAGCGIGIVGIMIKKLFPQAKVVMFDINERAVDLAKENCLYNQVDCTVIQSDGFSQINQSFDFVAINPPIHAGKAVVYRLFEEIHHHLRPQGIILVVIRKQHGATSAQNKIQEIFGNCDLVDRSHGYHLLKAYKFDFSQ